MGANAQTTVPTFVASQVLTADQMNQSARTGVPVFADSSARDAGFGGTGEKVLAEGQLCYLEDADVVQYYDGAAWATVGPASAGAVAQVKSTTISDTFSTTSTSFVDVTGLSVSITPTSASNKVLVIVTGNIGQNGAFVRGQVLRDSTAIGIGDAAGNRSRVGLVDTTLNTAAQSQIAYSFLDSPATTSATTYKLQIRTNNVSFAVYMNRAHDDSDIADRSRAISTITVMEVAP